MSSILKVLVLMSALAIVRSSRKPQRINWQQSLVREAGFTSLGATAANQANNRMRLALEMAALGDALGAGFDVDGASQVLAASVPM
jgi:hypothetical protein